jgi:predicted secreted Zn-dependent protease
MKFHVVVALSVGALFLQPVAAADRFQIEYYEVRGATVDALRRELDARGPFGDSGRRGDGLTRWNIAWRYGLDSNAARCTASNIIVDLDIRMILPRWAKPADVNPNLVARWNRYVAALRLHEDGHRELAETAAREVRQRLAAEPVARDCDRLRKRMDSRANERLNELRREQAEYDRVTDFGKQQGVRLP